MTQELKLSKYLVTSDALAVAGAERPTRVVYSTRSGAIRMLDARAWALVEAGRLDRLRAETRERLVRDQVLVPRDEDELATVVGQNVAAIEETDVLYQVVQPTAWCQLDCHYCGQDHTRARMSDGCQDAFVERVRARLTAGSYRALQIGWFGAEPLAGLGVIRSMSEKLVALTHELGVGYSAKIVTNGLALTPAVAAELLERHHVMQAEVTLDGLQADHDGRRFTKGGKGSFDRIFANLLRVAERTRLRLVIRCNVDHENADGVAALIQQVADRGLTERVSLYTSPVYSWGNDAHMRSLSREEYAEREMEWIAMQLRLGFQVGLVPPRRKIVCLAVQREGEVVDAHGGTFNCTEAPYVPAYGTPNLYSIRLPTRRDARPEPSAPARDERPARRLRDWNQQLLAREHDSCGDCAMLPVCGGQCPKSWHEGRAACPSAKINMRQRLNVLFATAMTKTMEAQA